MTTPKHALSLKPRPPSYVCRETGAAELEISPKTWDEWDRAGVLPARASGFPESSPRWRWSEVDAKLSGKTADEFDPLMTGAANMRNGPQKNVSQQ